MRALTTLLVVLAFLVGAADTSGARAMYADDPGTGGTWGVFYACLPAGCGWYLCWPGSPCQRL